MNIQAQLKAIEKNDFKMFDKIQKEKSEDREFLMIYLGITLNFDKGKNKEDDRATKKLNKEYEGKGLDQSAYQEFWQDFTA